MSGVNIEYKGESIATIPTTGSKTIKTQGKYCEGDILVEYEAPPTPTPTLITKQITENGTYTAADDNADGFSEVTVNLPQNYTVALIEGTVTNIENSEITIIRNNAFRDISTLKTVLFPSATILNSGAFYHCASLIRADFSSLETIRDSAFAGAANINIILRHCRPVLESYSAFPHAAQRIYAYQQDINEFFSTATNWITLYNAGQILPIEGSDYE